MSLYSRWLRILLAGSVLPAATVTYGSEYPDLAPDQVAWIGEQIFSNECNRRPACLTSWNAGEDFPSLGIGHFIWYRADQKEIYEESFPGLLAFMRDSGLALPAWLEAAGLKSPWRSREEFLADQDSARMQELRIFLQDHMPAQTAFIIRRFSASLDAILNPVNDPRSGTAQDKLRDNFARVANAAPPFGMYALIDYVNFKGTGVSASETHAGQGWGLKQVLLAMDDGEPALPAFVQAARQILARRVANAPPERNESRWLAGWNKRLDTYLPAPQAQVGQSEDNP